MTSPPDQRRGGSVRCWLVVALLWVGLLVWTAPAEAAPGLCVGPVCGDEFSRVAPYSWRLRLRVRDQQGHRERLVVDCRDGSISPLVGSVERGYAAAVGRRACRQAPLAPEAFPSPSP
ncbi:MAG: hypothetical protein ACK41W_02520 [Cyanobacteriota bacterium]